MIVVAPAPIAGVFVLDRSARHDELRIVGCPMLAVREQAIGLPHLLGDELERFALLSELMVQATVRRLEAPLGVSPAELAHAALNQSSVRSAQLVLVVAGTTNRSRGKYGGRAARYVTLEAGHAAQNVLLQATALGLAAVPVGAFSDEAVRHRLGLAETMTPYYLIAIGRPRAPTRR